jgi:hypothetical protein
MPLTPHAKYDTPCTIDERFERPWQPLYGISIKNIYIPKWSYPNTIKNLEFKGATVHAVSLTSHALFLHSKIDHISANSKQHTKRL